MNDAENSTLRESFARYIMDRIFSGEFAPGDKLPSERELAEETGLSRSLVHLGMEDLSRSCFVQMIPRKGNYVADFKKCGNFSTLEAIAKYGRLELEQNMAVSLVEMRNAVEGGAMLRLARDGTAADFDRLQALNEELEDLSRRTEDVAALAELLKRFHYEIVVLSGNYLFPLMMNVFEETGAPLWENCMRFWGAENVVRQNKELVEQLRSGRGLDAAASIIRIFDQYKLANNMR